MYFQFEVCNIHYRHFFNFVNFKLISNIFFLFLILFNESLTVFQNCLHNVTSVSKHTVISSSSSLWGAGVSLSFGQCPKALCLTRLRRRRKRIGGLYLPLLQAGARERFAFVVAKERVQIKYSLMIKFIFPEIITKL